METKINQEFDNIIGQIARTKSSYTEVFSDFCRITACAYALETREEEYLEVVKRYSKDELMSFAKAISILVNTMEENPYQDIIGAYHLEIVSRFSQKDRGEFYTPSALAEVMAQIVINPQKIREKSMPFRINEPTCGSGNIILSIAKTLSPDAVDLMRVTCQDISPLACDMCYINTVLWGIPAKIILGDTLRLERRKVWTNIHWHRVGEDKMEMIRSLFPPSDSDSQQPNPIEGQMSFTW